MAVCVRCASWVLLPLASTVALSCAEPVAMPDLLEGVARVTPLDGDSELCEGEWPFTGVPNADLCPDCDFVFELSPVDPDPCSIPAVAWQPSDRAPVVFLGYAASAYVDPWYEYSSYTGTEYHAGYTAGPSWFLAYHIDEATMAIDGSVSGSDGTWVVPLTEESWSGAARGLDVGVTGPAEITRFEEDDEGFSAGNSAMRINADVPRDAYLWTACTAYVDDLVGPEGKVKVDGPEETLPADMETGDRWLLPLEEGQTVVLLADASDEGDATQATPYIHVLRPDGCLAAGPSSTTLEGGDPFQDCSNGESVCPRATFTANVAGDWGVVVLLTARGDNERTYSLTAEVDGEPIMPTLDVDDAQVYGPENPETFYTFVDLSFPQAPGWRSTAGN